MGLKYKKKSKKKSVKKYKKKIEITKKSKGFFGKPFLEPNYRFKNNNDRWILITLNESCKLLESYKLIEKELEDIFGEDVIYFLPIYIEKVEGGITGFDLFGGDGTGGYIFVKCSETANEKNFNKKTCYLDKILRIGSNPQAITNRDINKLKTRLKLELVKRLPCKGSRIIAKEGTFKNQEGIVLSVNKKKKTAVIEFHKRTRIVTAKLSVINFELVK